jgi:hypothetical protein
MMPASSSILIAVEDGGAVLHRQNHRPGSRACSRVFGDLLATLEFLRRDRLSACWSRCGLLGSVDGRGSAVCGCSGRRVGGIYRRGRNRSLAGSLGSIRLFGWRRLFARRCRLALGLRLRRSGLFNRWSRGWLLALLLLGRLLGPFGLRCRLLGRRSCLLFGGLLLRRLFCRLCGGCRSGWDNRCRRCGLGRLVLRLVMFLRLALGLRRGG